MKDFEPTYFAPTAPQDLGRREQNQSKMESQIPRPAPLAMSPKGLDKFLNAVKSAVDSVTLPWAEMAVAGWAAGLAYGSLSAHFSPSIAHAFQGIAPGLPAPIAGAMLYGSLGPVAAVAMNALALSVKSLASRLQSDQPHMQAVAIEAKAGFTQTVQSSLKPMQPGV